MQPLLAPLTLIVHLAMGSPWWEQYELQETYICPDRGTLVVERNEAQASLLMGRYRSTLFRENSQLPGVRYGNEMLRLVLKGDLLTLEQSSEKLECLRSNDA
jgi:hypothetical protein